MRALLELLTWAAEYYRHPIGEVLMAALPVALRTGTPLFAQRKVWRLTVQGRERAEAELPQRARKLRAVIDHLRDVEHATAASLATNAQRIERDVARTGQARLRRATGSGRDVGHGERCQRRGCAAVERSSGARCRTHSQFSRHASSTWLLYGVTGSGKTEVYLNAIASVIERGEQALVLVPEIALTPQLIARFHAALRDAAGHPALGSERHRAT